MAEAPRILKSVLRDGDADIAKNQFVQAHAVQSGLPSFGALIEFQGLRHQMKGRG
jgi:hypothetical protein